VVIRRIQTLITLGSIAPLVLLGVSAIAFLGGSRYLELEELIAERGNVATSVLAATTQYGLLTGNAEEVIGAARNALLLPAVRHVTIYNPMGEPVASVGSSDATGRSTYTVHEEVIVPVTPESSAGGTVTIGAVEVQIDTTALVEKQNTALGLATAGLLLMIGFSVFASSKIATGIVRPIARLIQATKDVAEGRPTVIAETADNELRELEHGFNHMAKAITEHRHFLEEEVHAATMNLVQANQELQQKNQALEEAREREIQRRISEFTAFQEGANALRATLLHNIGNVVAGITSRCETLEGAASALGEISRLLKVAEDGDVRTVERLREVLVATQEELARISSTDIGATTGAILRASQHIGEIIRVQRTMGRPSEKIEPFSIAELLQDAKTVVQGLPIAENVDLVVIADAVPDIQVPKNELMQLVVNILKNGLESVATRYGNQRNKGLVFARASVPEPGWVEVAIYDNGVGFDEETAAKLFRFGYTTKTGGSGLGLHSAANFVQSIGGTIQPRSEGVGKGASFVLRLPNRRQRTR